MNLNKVLLIGRIGKDPEIRYTSAGDPIANFSLATTETWKKDGEKKERTSWHRVSAFGSTAKFLADYVGKGRLLYVEGSIQYDEYTDREGNKKHSTSIKAHKVSPLDSKRDNGDERVRQVQAEAEEVFTPSDDDVPF